MNRFIMHISWIDAQIVNQTLDSIVNALEFSTEPTEFLFFLNEQTNIDKPLEKTVEQQWEYFIHHPFISKCQLIYKTDNDAPFGVAGPRRDWMIRDGVNYWGESDCMLPIDFFYICENFHRQSKERPYILTFAERKMWPGWELQEHEIVRKESLGTLSKDISEQSFLRCDGPMSLDALYAFNEKQGNPKIELLPLDLSYSQDGALMVRNSIEGTLAVLSDKMPQNLICPDLVLSHDDACLQWTRNFYQIPQFHVGNILKGHDNWNPLKRTNIVNPMGLRNPEHVKLATADRLAMGDWLTRLFRGEIK